MESFPVEKDPVDAVRRFFAEYGKTVIAGLVLGIIALTGWYYWQSYQKMTRIEIASTWQQVNQALLTDKANGVAAMERFASSNSNNYGALASLQLSRYFIENNEFAKAEQQLMQASRQTKESNLLALIKLQLARIQLQQKKPDDALKTLNTVTGTGWAAMVQAVRGDALLSQGHIQGARDAYANGIQSGASEELNSLLRMKLNNLSS